MKVTVITACFNNEDTIGKTIESVKEQTYGDIEHLFIDGASTDRTLAVIKELAPDARVISEKDNGIYDALNKGISLSTGDITGILHADDFYAAPDVLEKTVQQMLDSGAEGLYGDLVYVDRQNPERVIRSWKSGKYSENSFLWGWMPPHPTFFVKREVYEKYGKFNLALRSAADYELMLRLIHKHGIKLVYLPEVMVKMRVGGQSNVSLGNRLKANTEDRKAWEMNEISPFWFTRFLKPLRKIKQFFLK